MMTSVSFEVTFQVVAKTRPGEVVCIVGDCPELGLWCPHQAKQMIRQTRRWNGSTEEIASQSFEENIDDGDIWMKTVRLEGFQDRRYRYFICQTFAPDSEDSEKMVMVKWWEGFLKPRLFSPHAAMQRQASGTIPEPDKFGEHDGIRLINWGWLTDQSQIHIRFRSNAIKMWKPRYREQLYSVKCTPLDHRFKDQVDDHFDEEVLEDSVPRCARTIIYVSALEKGRSKPVPQGEYGALYKPDTFMSFHADTFEPESLGLQLEFFVHRDNAPPKHVGTSFMLPLDMKSTMGKKEIPITGLKYKPIGTIKVDFLIIKPLMRHWFKMETTFQRYWKSARRALEVGHRGMGTSYKHRKLATVRENTVASLASAANHGADFVEFDVQLSKDKVPVIYHDFKVLITYRMKKRDDLELFEIPVKDLKLSELQNMKLSHPSCQPTDKYDGIQEDDIDPEDLQPFPTLKRVFEAVDIHTGFNIEVKSPLYKVDGSCQQENYFDLNEYVDTVLNVVFDSHAGRRIVFSSFDPDCCLALRLKQNKYPVLFLTQADTDRYVMYEDWRARTVQRATEFARSAGLLGIDVVADVLLKDMALIQYVKDAGQVLFVWGEGCNDKEAIQKFREHKVDGIIYDRIDFYKTTGKESIFKIEDTQKRHLLRRLGSLQVHNGDSDNGEDNQDSGTDCLS